jgi:hypothetical protein
MAAVPDPRRGEVLLLAASVLLFLLVAEAVVRLLGGGEAGPSGYAPVNTDGRSRRPINKKGYRDLERAPARPPGVRRLVSLGDSFAWGASVEFEDAYPQRLERGLTRRRGERWEVVNLALPGMNTASQAEQLATEGMAYGPDAVLVGFVLNDSEDPDSAEARRAREWALERRQEATGRSLLARSALFRMVSTRLWATVENRRRIAGFRSMYLPDAPGWIEARKALRAMSGLCRERGIPLVVAIFPLFGNPLDEDYPFTAIHAEVARAATAAGARVVDLLPAYRGLRWELLVVNGAADEHPNEIAHRIAADTLLKALDDVGPWTEKK